MKKVLTNFEYQYKLIKVLTLENNRIQQFSHWIQYHTEIEFNNIHTETKNANVVGVRLCTLTP